MAMKLPTPTKTLESKLTALREYTEETKQFTDSTRQSLNEYNLKKSLNQNNKDNITLEDFRNYEAFHVPKLLRMITEPLNEICKDATKPHLQVPTTAASTNEPKPDSQPSLTFEGLTSLPTPRIGLSKSQDDDYNVECTEQKFGSVSPIPVSGNHRGSISSIGAARASNFRHQKFRKSHTCGSLFAKCNCASQAFPATPTHTSTTLTAPIPIHYQNTSSTTTTTHSGSFLYRQKSDASCSEYYSSMIPTPSSFHLSISPTSNTDLSSTSTRYTSGIYSLSAQTSSATSAHLSRDESMSTSFDLSGNTTQAFNTFSESTSTGGDSQQEAKHKQVTSHSNTNIITEKAPSHSLQIPQINSPQFLNVTHRDPSCPSKHLQTSSSIAGEKSAATSKVDRKSRRLFQSYSHPDTDFIFTEANRNPPRESVVQLQKESEQVITARGGKVEIKHPKRSSSPNIGQYQVLDVAVHPDILVKISPKHSPSIETNRFYTSTSPAASQCASSSIRTATAQQRRRFLQRSHEIESGGSTSESEHSFDLPRSTNLQSDQQSNPALGKSPLALDSTIQQTPQTATKATSPIKVPLTKNLSQQSSSLGSPISPRPIQKTLCSKATSPINIDYDGNFVAAHKYFAESGILGPITSPATTNLIRKTSKILQDANVIEQIRKTSMILRANSTSNLLSKKTSTIISPTRTTATSPNTTTIVDANTNAPLTPFTQIETQAQLLATPDVSCDIDPVKPKLSINTKRSVSNVGMETPSAIMYAPSAPASPHTLATTCGFSPNRTTQSSAITDDRDAQIKSLQGEIVSLKDVIKSRDAEIMKLRREIHKLKSVLQQTTTHLPITHDDLLKSPSPIGSKNFSFPQQCQKVTSTTNSSASLSLASQLSCSCCKKYFELQQQSILENQIIDSKLSNPNISSSALPNINELSIKSSNENDKSNGPPASVISSSSSSSLIASSSSLSSASSASSSSTLTTSNTGSSVDTNTVTCALGDNPDYIAIASANKDQIATNGIKIKINNITTAPVLRKQGVSAESCEISMQQSFNIPIPTFDKDYRSKQLIKDAIMDNDFLKNIDASQVRELVESMYPLTVEKGEFVIREGEVGAHLYVSAEGELEVIQNGNTLGVMGPGKAFGELAILYNCTRTASIKVLSDARLWVLDRRVFQQIMMRTGMQRIENSVNFLRSVPLLKNLSEEVLAKIADVLEVEFYPAGTYIIRQGASGDTFFLISQGSVQVTQKLSSSSEEKEIRTLQRGDYFGEQALINEDKRTANIIAMSPGVECLTLDRDSFTHLIGDLCELKEKNYGDQNRVLAMKFSEKNKEIFGANLIPKFPDLKLTDLELVATLGIGGFGRVELVKAYHKDGKEDVFALKCLKKRHIVDTKQEEHIYSERTIMMSCESPFICRLYRTFRDEKYVYMLLEACMGGEIWTMLRDRGSVDDNAAQFIVGCVLQAFEYLHQRGIIYRDLKPENLMLSERGYVKLVDFGFAKCIGNGSKTWTFCGTPEYIAPEIILNKGHDHAVDYWSLGILIHELLNGTPPFTADDPMQTYNIILKGIDMINFPKRMSRSAIQLIKRLCRDVPAERLGYQRGGIQDIKKHKWFLGFDWDGLENQTLKPPFVRPVANATDTCYFDKFPCDESEPPDETSGWDVDF